MAAITRQQNIDKTNLKVLDRLNAMGSLYYAQILDRLAASVPESIWLNELAVNPFTDKLTNTKNEFPQVEHGNIHIKGRTDDIKDLNQWAKKLNRLDWAKKVEVVSVTEFQSDLVFELKIEFE